MVLLLHFLLLFQSTLPRGSDAVAAFSAVLIRYFNPRSLAGATPQSPTLLLSTATISIHAPSRERLLNEQRTANKNRISIHAPSRERPLIAQGRISILDISIHAPSRERQSSGRLPSVEMIFQSTLPRGSDKYGMLTEPEFSDFNPRSLAGATWFVMKNWEIWKFQSTLPRGSD